MSTHAEVAYRTLRPRLQSFNKMPSTIEEMNEALCKEWETNESARNVLCSIVDDSEDDNPSIMEAEREREGLYDRLQETLLARNSLQRITDKLSLPLTSKPIMKRRIFQILLQENTETYNRMSNRRLQAANRFNISRYAMNTQSSLDSKSDSPSVLKMPGFTWRLAFKKLSISKVDVWTDLNYDEASLHKWWRKKQAHLIPFDSHGWSDLKRLARRVVIQILEHIDYLAYRGCRYIDHIKIIAERAREIILYQLILCYNLPLKWVADFQELFELSVPVIYLISEIIRVSKGIPRNARTEINQIERKIQILELYVQDLRNRCYIFGDRVGFDVYDYMDDFKAGAVFDFKDDVGKVGANGSIALERRLAGETENEFMKRMRRMGEKQSRVKETTRVDPETSSSVSHRGDTGKSMREVLEDLGLKELKDIIYDSRLCKGSGGYADVFEMYQPSGSKQVAVKICKKGLQSAERLEREARIWVKLDHRNIVRLLGFVVFGSSQGPQPCLVSEALHTDLKQFLRIYQNSMNASQKQPLTEARKLEFLRDIAFGLDYLHACDIAHGDLRAANVLVTNDRVDDESCYAVLNDFGMAEHTGTDTNRIFDHRDLSSVNQCTQERWLAPELVLDQPRPESKARVSKAGDVYAFGVVYLEVMYERDPYERTLYNIRHAKSIGELPAKQEDLEQGSDEHWELMCNCWETADKRWNVQEVACEVLTRLERALPPTPADYVSSDMSGLPETFTQYIM